MNIFLTGKIYFHFVDENDDDLYCKDDGIGGDGGNYYSDGGKDKDKKGRDGWSRPWLCWGVTVCLRLTEEGVDDLELFGGEDFAGAGVGGFGEFGHQWLIGVDFTGEEFSCALLAAVGEIGHSQILLVHKHNNEI